MSQLSSESYSAFGWLHEVNNQFSWQCTSLNPNSCIIPISATIPFICTFFIIFVFFRFSVCLPDYIATRINFSVAWLILQQIWGHWKADQSVVTYENIGKKRTERCPNLWGTRADWVEAFSWMGASEKDMPIVVWHNYFPFQKEVTLSNAEGGLREQPKNRFHDIWFMNQPGFQ